MTIKQKNACARSILLLSKIILKKKRDVENEEIKT